MLLLTVVEIEDIFVPLQVIGPVEEPASTVSKAEASQAEESEGQQSQNLCPCLEDYFVIKLRD